MNIWSNKRENAARAKQSYHNMEQSKTAMEYTLKSKAGSKIYDGLFCSIVDPERTTDMPRIDFCNTDTISAAVRYIQNNVDPVKVLVLNFASFKHPGGMFLRGSMAQEESICHKSNLYNILKRFDDEFYAPNREAAKSNPLYNDRAIYTPDVLLLNGVIWNFIDVISCAAPNINTNNVIPTEVYMEYLHRRMKFLRHIVYDNSFDYLILGAWGCGVFKNDPKTILNLFVNTFYPCANLKGKTIVFAVPGNDINANTFRNVADLYYGKYA